MTTRQKKSAAIVLIGAFGAVGYAYYQAQTQHAVSLALITALETRLAVSNQQRAQAAKNMVFGISEVVRKNYNLPADIAVLRQAQQIQDSTQALLVQLHQLRQAWQVLGNKAETGELPAQLGRYISFIRQFAPDTPLTRYSAQTTAISWPGEFEGQAESKPVALALLTKLETRVLQAAANALVQQAVKVGSRCCFCFDRIEVLAVPTAKVVAPGALYQAQLILAVGASNIRFLPSADGRILPRDAKTGQGLVQFAVPAVQPGQPDTIRMQWHSRVQMPWAASDTVLETTVPYFIIKPVHR